MNRLEAYFQAGGWKIDLQTEQIEQLQAYMQLLMEWNEKINLTAIIQPDEIVVKHYLDALALLQFAPPEEGASVLDVGSGAGFPGMVLKIVRPDLQVTCMDGTQKRIHFLSLLAGSLHLQNVDCIHARAEEAGHNAAMREAFSYVTARAVANLRALSEYALPFVKVGGRFVAMKGPDGENEVKEAAHAIYVLGGEVQQIHTYTLPTTEFSRTIIEIRKVRQTPVDYPRSAGKMKKKPL